MEGEFDPNLATLIVGIATALVLAAGHFLARRGQKEQAEQQRAANNLAAVERQRDRAEAAEIRERDRADRERDRADRAEDEIDEVRLLARKREAEQEQRCRDNEARLVDALNTLQRIVLDEVAKAAATEVVDKRKPHPHDKTEA